MKYPKNKLLEKRYNRLTTRKLLKLAVYTTLFASCAAAFSFAVSVGITKELNRADIAREHNIEQCVKAWRAENKRTYFMPQSEFEKCGG